MMTTMPDYGNSEFCSNVDYFDGDPPGPDFDDTIDLDILFQTPEQPEPNTLPPAPPEQEQRQLLVQDPSKIDSFYVSGDAPCCWSFGAFGNHNGSCPYADASASPASGLYLNIGHCGLSSDNSAETTEMPGSNETSWSGCVSENGVHQFSESVTANGSSAMPPYWSEVGDFSRQQFHDSTNNEAMPNSKDMLNNFGVEATNSSIFFMDQVGGVDKAISEDSTIDFFYQGSDSIESSGLNSCSSGNASPYEALTQPLDRSLFENQKQSLDNKYQMNIAPFMINSTSNYEAGMSHQEFVHLPPRQTSPMDSKKFLPSRFSLKSSFPDLLPSYGSISMKQGVDHVGDRLTTGRFSLSRVKPEVIQVQVSSSDDKVNDDDDITEISSIEYVSQAARASPSFPRTPLTHHPTFTPLLTPMDLPITHQATFTPPLPPMVAVSTRHRQDERRIYQAALQDLSQPKTEATPPEGVLAVSLLRHQRIALSWMVQKETSSLQCCGGILADDQGLGKTVSTIALILKEKRPSAKTMAEKPKSEPETLDLEEGDGHFSNFDMSLKLDAKFANIEKNSHVIKGRPSAGTLVVCPTSVLRQWAEELRTKVSRKADLSVLVYHGSNRTKDPCELARYDVVLTTYAIVSMEVPKQSLMEKEGKGMHLDDVPPFTSSKKRKQRANLDKRSSKKGLDSASLDSFSRPLARVAWFRVVLDEAQSIKNYRTRAAQACWGLRAKRRWCLSGTPIQNTIDDLYSYFRFLRYDPYSAFKLFCSMIKLPISRSPSTGYKKLQAVLKTIMLRRTKGTLLDGQPIINLPPKSVNLRKIEFSCEEREFYAKLETDSRAKFQDYADKGTVEKNMVNILLMLLRLRQACDHPLLVAGYDSNSVLQPSLDMAKKLSQKQLSCLLNCLEASLAICSMCRDPPEDAVVSICEHAFCNQCVSEHLSGDDKQCPVMNCEAQLSASSVFSGATLKHCLNGQDVNCDRKEAVEAFVEDRLFQSSKIKATLEVLQSMNKPQNCSLDDDSAHCKVGTGTVSAVREKAIVFSQWTKMLDLLEIWLKGSSIKYRRLDGTMPIAVRDKAVKEFNTMPEVTVMIMSLKAASLGLNMVAACHVLLLDLWWNPTTEDQAIDRAHRIGQTRPVTVVRMTVRDTVEDRILALQQKKREMVASAFGEDEMGSRQTRLNVDDLNFLFTGGGPSLFNQSG